MAATCGPAMMEPAKERLMVEGGTFISETTGFTSTPGRPVLADRDGHLSAEHDGRHGSGWRMALAHSVQAARPA